VKETVMSDDHPNSATTRIDVREPEAVRYWTEALGVTEEVLNEAVDHVGSSEEDVRKYIGSNS
jgi:hypothetical protein